MGDARRVGRLLWGVVRRDNPRRAAAAVVLDLIGIAGGVALIALWLKLIVDGAAAGDRGAVVVAGVGLALSLSLSGAVTAWTAALFQDLHESGGLVLMQDVMRHAAGVPGIEHHERPEYADRIALVRSQGRMLTGFVGTAGRTVSFAARVAVTVVLLASVHPALLALPLLAVPSAWTGARARRAVEAAREATAEQARLAEHLFGLATQAAGAKEVRVYRLEAEVARLQGQAWDGVAAAMARANLRAGLLRAAGWMPFLAGFAGAILLATSLAARGAATAGDVLLVVALATDVGAQVGRAVALAGESAGLYRAAQRLLWLADYAAAARVPVGEPAPVPERLTAGIAFEQVAFRYPGTGTDVLAGIDLHLPAGAVVAVVGENGAGKSTLVKLLTRCYEPTAGRVLVDGTDLRRFDVDQWRERLSAGFQDYLRMGVLLRDAVGAGHLPRLDDIAGIETALSRAQAGDLGAALPAGLDTHLGKEFAGGTDLSEGQWQKVAIARALMFEEPLLLVLDEPTSGLDPGAEHALFERYAEAAAAAASRRGAVTVLISHRFSTVRLADLIVVLAGGRVVECGSHAQLMAAPGLYADLYSAQARALMRP